MTTPKLLPCPFCGWPEILMDETRDYTDGLENEELRVFSARCANCDSVSGSGPNKKEVASIWNRRDRHFNLFTSYMVGYLVGYDDAVSERHKTTVTSSGTGFVSEANE